MSSVKEYRLKHLFIKRIGGAWGTEPDDDSVICLRAADIETDQMIHKSNDLTYRTFSDNELNSRKLSPGDIIIEKSGGGENQPVGRVAKFVLNEAALCSNFLDLLRPNNKIVNTDYLTYILYYLWKNRTVVKSIKQTTGIQNLDIEDYLNNKANLPSLEQQNKIVNYLDRETAKIDALIEKKTKLIALLEEKKKAVINQAVTKGLDTTVAMKDTGIEWLGEIPEHWEVVKLKYLVNKIDELNYADVEHKIAVENIIGFSGKLTNLESYNYEGITTKFKKNDIIFNKLRPYLGKVYLAKEEGGVYGELLVLRPNEKLVSKFLFYVMISTNFIDLVNSSTTGAKMPRASWEDFIKHIDIPLISIDEQQNITDFLEIMLTKNEELSNRLLSSIELLKEKRTTIISAAINGEINLD